MTVDQRTQAFREWIAAIQSKLSINRTELARRAGLSHSLLSRATTDNTYKINFRIETINKLAEISGIAPPHLLDGDAHKPEKIPKETEVTLVTRDFSGDLEPGQLEGTLNTDALTPMGLLPGDRFVVDQRLQPRNGDVIMVMEFDRQKGGNTPIMRVFADGFAVLPLYLLDGSKRIWIDGQNASIAGVVSKSWRVRPN